MSSRDKILERIRGALKAAPGPTEMPSAPSVWPSGNRVREELCREFAASLAAVGGETVVCRTKEEAAERITAFLKEIAATKIGVADRKIVTETLAHAIGFRDGSSDFERFPVLRTNNSHAPDVASDVSPQAIAALDASLIGAEYLLTDTGSAVVASATAFDRMLCYLPPVCCVVATERMLREHLPAAWPEICQRIRGETADSPEASPDADPNVPIQHLGEFLIVTGPSRTADIEKILVMGVHGPKRLVVFVIAES